MVYLISINCKWMLGGDQAFCESYTCVIFRNANKTVCTSIIMIYKWAHAEVPGCFATNPFPPLDISPKDF